MQKYLVFSWRASLAQVGPASKSFHEKTTGLLSGQFGAQIAN
jgi:hypothetical protein